MAVGNKKKLTQEIFNSVHCNFDTLGSLALNLPWMPEVFLSLSDRILRSGERNLWYVPSSSLRTPVQWDAVSYFQSQILTLAIQFVPGSQHVSSNKYSDWFSNRK